MARVHPQHGRISFNLRSMFFGLTVVSVLLGLGIWLFETVTGPAVPLKQLRLLREDMTTAQVRSILGEPQHIYTDSSTQSPSYAAWIYESRFNPGWVELIFDPKGHLSSLNDESAFPSGIGLAPPE